MTVSPLTLYWTARRRLDCLRAFEAPTPENLAEATRCAQAMQFLAPAAQEEAEELRRSMARQDAEDRQRRSLLTHHDWTL